MVYIKEGIVSIQIIAGLLQTASSVLWMNVEMGTAIDTK